MKELSKNVIHLLQKQGFVIVSTLDAEGKIHCAAKGMVGVEQEGKVYLIDLYMGNTYHNLQKNQTVSITSIDEAKFEGYTLKGKANIIAREKIQGHVIESWEQRVVERISNRLIKNVQDAKSGKHHPEAAFPHPKYLIEMEVDDVVDLSPSRLKS
ncbi:MAG: pyridoxamine 5'-phosphate oxidase family protein [PVC group bacterium]|nr:pyridoxamine 5'-phosphate oxidase family protein [PVC group bacterium]